MVAPTATAPALEALGPGAGQPGLDITSFLPERSAQDILAGEVHVQLARREYVLPVLSIAATRRWRATLESTVTAMLDTVDEAGDDLSSILGTLAGATDQLLDALYAYDEGGHLPPRAQLEEEATGIEVMQAAFAVWAAANPFALAAVGAMRSQATAARPQPASSTPTNGAPQPTAGRPRSSSAS